LNHAGKEKGTRASQYVLPVTSAQYTDSSNIAHWTDYVYTGDDLFAIMRKTVGSSMTEARFIRAGFLPIQERDGSNAVIREYTWGLNMGGGIGGLLGLRQNSSDFFYLYDGKGNVTSLIDSTQATLGCGRITHWSASCGRSEGEIE